MNQAPIGIVDSGLGGITIWRSIRTLLPRESTIFVGDHAFVPYGTKSRFLIRKRVLAIMAYLRSRGAKLIVVACNTATVAGIDWYRQQLRDIPIVGVVPVIKTAAALSKSKKFVVIATPFTTKSKYQKGLISKFAPDAQVFSLSTPQLVDLVEMGTLSGAKTTKILKPLLAPLIKKGIDIVVLGSTHFAFLAGTIRAIVGDGIAVLESGDAVARQVRRILEAERLLIPDVQSYFTSDVQSYRFETTGNPNQVSVVASKLMGQPMKFFYADI